jgi:hypothetical protein
VSEYQGFIWLGIALCLTQSAMFSGLNLAMFGVSRLRLEVEVADGNRHAAAILALREDSNFLLTTILWGNVGINVLLTLLSDSVLAGVSAFVFSTVVITLVGEIAPQAYFSRNALRMGAMLAPLLRFYQFLLYPVAKPSAMVLDLWLGEESVQWFREHQLRQVIKKHVEAEESEVDRLEGIGALNFLALDDLMVSEVGENVDPQSVIALPMLGLRPQFPDFQPRRDDPFVHHIEASGHKWVIVTDLDHQPQMALDADAFIRELFFSDDPVNPLRFCHRPILVTDRKVLLAEVLRHLRVNPEHPADDVIDHDLVLVWAEDRRIITGADILGRLLRGIVRRQLGRG